MKYQSCEYDNRGGWRHTPFTVFQIEYVWIIRCVFAQMPCLLKTCSYTVWLHSTVPSWWKAWCFCRRDRCARAGLLTNWRNWEGETNIPSNRQKIKHGKILPLQWTPSEKVFNTSWLFKCIPWYRWHYTLFERKFTRIKGPRFCLRPKNTTVIKLERVSLVY